VPNMVRIMGPTPLQCDWYEIRALVVVRVFAKALDENALY